MAITFVNTYNIGYGFINKKFAKEICKVLKIKSQHFIKLKQISRFDDKVTKSIIHIIYLSLIVDTHIKSLVLLLIIKLRYY